MLTPKDNEIKFITDINEKLNKLHFSECDIDDLVCSLDNYTDLSYKVFRKYGSAVRSKNPKIIVDEEDAEFIEAIFKESDNILVRAYESYLLASCKKYYKQSQLVKIVKEYIELYFQNVTSLTGGCALHNMLVLLRWCVYKFTQEKLAIADKLYDYLMKDKLGDIRSLSIIGGIINKIDTDWFFTSSQYLNLYKKFIPIKTVDKAIVRFYYYQINSFLKLRFPKDILEKIKKDLCDYSICNVKTFEDTCAQIELQKIRECMDELKSYSDADYAIIDKRLEAANNSILEKLETHQIVLDKKTNKLLENCLERQEEKYSKLTNTDKIKQLLFETYPLSMAKIKKSIAKDVDFPFNMFPTRMLDETGRVINYKKMAEEEIFSLKAIQYIGRKVDVYMTLCFCPFNKAFVNDDGAKKLIFEVLNNNILVSEYQVEILQELFIDFFSADYRHSVYSIVEEFESSLRFFFKNKGLNIKKRDGSGDVISLTNIFNNYKKNSYRDEFLKYIDEDYYFTLKWFLTDKYGFDFRDKIAHRLSSKKLYNTNLAIFTVLQIFRLYFGFKVIEFE